jgi:hypothetical protein
MAKYIALLDDNIFNKGYGSSEKTCKHKELVFFSRTKIPKCNNDVYCLGYCEEHYQKFLIIDKHVKTHFK